MVERAGLRPDTKVTEKNQQFRALGFRCLQSAEVRFLDGSAATVKAHSFRDSKMRSDDDAAQMREFRIYEVRREGKPGAELITERELELLMGLEEFSRLA